MQTLKKVALVIGHRRKSPGALNIMTGMNEHTYCQNLAYNIKEKLTGIDVEVIHRHTFESLPAQINAGKPDFIISLHCNAYNQNVSGSEVLYYHKSSKGRQIAEILQHHIAMALGLNNRGTKAKRVEDRGGYLLKYTDAPCVISEPFFIDNDNDLRCAIDNRTGLVDAYCNAIKIMADLQEVEAA